MVINEEARHIVVLRRGQFCESFVDILKKKSV